MDTLTLTAPPLDLRASLSAINVEKRSATLTWSTGADVLRADWTGRRIWERLSLDPKHVRMGRLASGSAPLLNSHGAFSLSDQLGVVERAWIVQGQGLAEVRFSDRPEVEDGVWRDVRNGIDRNGSVGYRVHKFEELGEKRDNLPVWLAVDWEPYEVSIVAIGADAGAGIRADAAKPNPCIVVQSAVRSDGHLYLRLCRARLAGVGG